MTVEQYLCFTCNKTYRQYLDPQISCAVAHSDNHCHYGESLVQHWWEWDKQLGTGIMDPDGFRSSKEVYEALYSFEEFKTRAMSCTVLSVNGFFDAWGNP